jgi:hypothetical protein
MSRECNWDGFGIPDYREKSFVPQGLYVLSVQFGKAPYIYRETPATHRPIIPSAIRTLNSLRKGLVMYHPKTFPNINLIIYMCMYLLVNTLGNGDKPWAV